MNGYDVEGGNRSGGGQRGMEDCAAQCADLH